MILNRKVENDDWAICYDKAIREDGTLLFPEKLSRSFLDGQRKAQGSYIFAHQYQNEIIPSEDQDFKKEWLSYYDKLPENLNHVVVVDPAISLDQEACYTSIVGLACDEANHRYIRLAKRMRITATQTVDLIFRAYDLLKPSVIAIEAVAYQMALLHFLVAECKRRQKHLPLMEIKRAPDKSKMTRIRSLVPWFEWQHTSVKPGLHEFEDEYLKFPRGSYVDILDALADAQELISPPGKPKENLNAPSPNDPSYEKWYIKRLHERKAKSA